MDFLSKRSIPEPLPGEQVFRVAALGPVIGLSVMLLAVTGGALFFVVSYQNVNLWGMILSGLYVLLMLGLCLIMLPVVSAVFSPANWLFRLGPQGMLIKYRSYLHDDSPDDDPIAVMFSWPEIANARLQQETQTTTDSDGKRDIRRWFVILNVSAQYNSLNRLQQALVFEQQRKPLHFEIDELKRKLFQLRKNKANSSEIMQVKQAIVSARKRFPGRQRKWWSSDRPVTFRAPDELCIECSTITPGKVRLRQLLGQYKILGAERHQHKDLTSQLDDQEFKASLSLFLQRDEILEAVKLVRQHTGMDITEARDYIDKVRHS